jgi:hypothetical protein
MDTFASMATGQKPKSDEVIDVEFTEVDVSAPQGVKND